MATTNNFVVKNGLTVGTTNVINSSGQWIGPGTNITGDTGAPGVQGIRGVRGLGGNSGDGATVGAQGAVGAQGTIGAQGPQGFQGSQGAAGPTGAQGAKTGGPQGAQGAAGPQGAQGPQGPPSDSRLKTNVTPLTNITKKIVEMRGVSFDWLEDIPQLESYPLNQQYLIRGKSIGYIAQEIEKLFPEIVLEDRYGYKNIQYDILVSVGVAALQENQKRITILKNKLQPIKSLISG